ncbi:MAG: endonuclease/exonuclease/phosphatase family protein [Myxococcota bacterium]|nr:endonuclease/exonuclease/phosphatase family protein [Myxococcota bacterium]
MIDRVELLWAQARRVLSRSAWSARLLRLARAGGSGGPSADPGLLMVQIDGLAHRHLERALRDGWMPGLRRLIEAEGYRLRHVYAGLPSTTPAVEAELFYGVRHAVPAFSFADRAAERVVRMYERDRVAEVERELAARGGEALLAGGSAYCDIYTGGAADPRFCMASMGWGDLVRAAHPLGLPVLALLHLPDLLRTAASAAWELLRALGGLARAVRAGEDLGVELRYLQTRVLICVVLREMVATGARVDLARGLPIVHLNWLGYDEYAHRRGPGSREALRSLRAVDRAIARLVRAARRSPHRHYDVWIHSDHGQEATRAYVERHGRRVQDAVADVFRAHGIEAQPHGDPPRGIQAQRARLLGETLIRALAPGMDTARQAFEPGRLLVTAQGPLGHVYAPRPLGADERDRVARDLVAEAHVPLVLARAGPGELRAWTPAGVFSLPRDAEPVLGRTHRYRAQVARDLVAICEHPLAGELVISGYAPDGESLSFPHENGAHAGPGPDETDAFVIAPADAPLPERGTLRHLDLRRGALEWLGRAPRTGAPRPSRPRDGERTLRLVTYNVHSCVGLDGKLSPERIARVLARLDPDVVALQELDVGRARTGGIDQAELIARELEMMLHFHPTVTVEEEQFGDAILSRLPTTRVHAGPLPGLPGRPDREPRGALWVRVEAGGRELQVINTHLGLSARERGRQVDALLGPEWLGHPDCSAHRVLCGDLNALPWFPVCRRLGRVLRDCQNGLREHRPRRTWGSRLPVGRIDHVFADRSLAVVRVEVPATELTRVASDHLPVVVDLRLPDA